MRRYGLLILLMALIIPHAAQSAESGSLSSSGDITLNDFTSAPTVNVQLSESVTLVWKTDPSTAIVAAKHTKSENAYGFDSEGTSRYMRSGYTVGTDIVVGDIPDPTVQQNDLSADANWRVR